MKIIRIILGIFIVFCVTFSFLFANEKIGEKRKETLNQQRSIIIGWQIDGFEGGIGSRRNFLLDVSKGFEKLNNDYLITINSYTEAEANLRLSQGILPDFISFSHGVNVNQQQELKTDYYAPGGLVGNKTYALPWCRGGYVLISKKDVFSNKNFNKVIVSNSEYTMPIFAFLEDGYSAQKYDVYSPKIAFQRFLAEDAVLLGTQRDVVRLENNDGIFYYKPIEKFNDLYQYISITSKEESKITAINEFIDLLLSEKKQKKLSTIKMFSDVVELDYLNEILDNMQKLYDFSTTSVFMGADNISITKDKLLSIKNIKDAEYIKIKNLIVKP